MTVLTDLLGLPWESGASGPDAYDCWGLVREVQRRLYNRDVYRVDNPPVDIKSIIELMRSSPARAQWKQTDELAHGCVVELSNSNHPHHVGVYLDIDHGGLIHSAYGSGVCFDSLVTLKHAMGFRNFRYHVWNA